MTFAVLKLLKSSEVRLEQKLNIPSIPQTFAVLKLLRLRLVKLAQSLNI